LNAAEIFIWRVFQFYKNLYFLCCMFIDILVKLNIPLQRKLSMAKKDDSGAIVLSALEEDILTVVLPHAQGVYGLDILNRINAANKKIGRRTIGVGSLYPALKRMEQQGLIAGRWGDEAIEDEESGGARRRYYSISAQGKKALQDTRNYREQLEQAAIGQLAPEGFRLGSRLWASVMRTQLEQATGEV
jgi:DNA-binding PadR family transcriptional regulator